MADVVLWADAGQIGLAIARRVGYGKKIIVTPLAVDESELLMGPAGAFISGSTFLMDGGATASYYYGALKPQE